MGGVPEAKPHPAAVCKGWGGAGEKWDSRQRPGGVSVSATTRGWAVDKL